MPQIKKILTVFSIGAVCYSALEILWRGFAHWSMSLAGGVCMCGIYTINDKMKKINRMEKCALCTLLITTVEFLFGVIFNLILHMHIWDYSRFKYNILGQVCLIYSLLWFIVSFPALRICDYLKKNMLD